MCSVAGLLFCVSWHLIKTAYFHIFVCVKHMKNFKRVVFMHLVDLTMKSLLGLFKQVLEAEEKP